MSLPALTVPYPLAHSILLALMMLSGIAGQNIEKSLIEISSYAKGMLLALILTNIIKDVGQIRLLSIYCLVGLAFGSSIALYQHITGQFTIDVNGIKRATSLNADPNETAMLFCVGLSYSAMASTAV